MSGRNIKNLKNKHNIKNLKNNNLKTESKVIDVDAHKAPKKSNKILSIYTWGLVICGIGFSINECNKIVKKPQGQFLGHDDHLERVALGTLAILVGMSYGVVWPITLPIALIHLPLEMSKAHTNE